MMPIGVPDPERFSRAAKGISLLLQSFAKGYMDQLEMTYLEGRVLPWLGLAAPLWTRYTEVVIGRRLWLSFDDWGPYETMPATDSISRKRKYIKEKNVSIYNGFTIKSVLMGSNGVYNRNVDMDFDIKSGAKDEVDSAEIVIYNIEPSLSPFFENSLIMIRSGYVQAYDTIFAGNIETIEPQYEKSGTSIKIKAYSDFKSFMGKLHFSREYPTGTKYMTIIQDLLDMMPLPIGYICPTEEITEESFTFDPDSTIKSQFDKISEHLNYTYVYNGNKFYFIPKDQPVINEGKGWTYAFSSGLPIPVFKIGILNGLLSIQKQTEDEGVKYNVTTLLLPYYSVRSVLDVDSHLFGKKRLIVNELEFKSDELSHYATMKCEEMFVEHVEVSD